MPARPLVRLLACVATCLAVASGCGDRTSNRADSPPTTGHSSATATASPTHSPIYSASNTPTNSSSAAATGTPSSGTSPAPSSKIPTSSGPLLSAAEVPGFTDSYRWRPGGTAPGEPRTSFGTCQRFAITAIGAERVVVRRFLAPVASRRRDRAGELVATFPDAATARRAYAVLTAWRAKCADRLPDSVGSKVGDLADVPVDTGHAGWFLLRYRPAAGTSVAGSRVYDAQGMALVGPRLAMVAMVRIAKEYRYPPGHEPMVAALQRAARKLS